jgi:hypothetical protein
MPIPKVDVTRKRCADCGGRTGGCDEDAFCYGCGRIVCEVCTLENDHFGDGAHAQVSSGADR